MSGSFWGFPCYGFPQYWSIKMDRHMESVVETGILVVTRLQEFGNVGPPFLGGFHEKDCSL